MTAPGSRLGGGDDGPHIPLVEPRTERLWLRQWRDADWPPFAALNADPAVMRHFPATLTEAESTAFAYRNAALLEVRGYGLWAVEERATGQFVGMVGLNRPQWDAPFTPCTEVGWRLARSAWGQGMRRKPPAPRSRWPSAPSTSRRSSPSPSSPTPPAEP